MPETENIAAKNVQRTYLLLTLLSTLAASFIWGINTLFLLDAGLSNTAAFAANAFFTVGMVLFEIPTGVIADTKGRRNSFALGALTLLITTLGYLWLWHISAPFWMWALMSALLGLGFTFFSGATEAWLVDALTFTKFTGTLESVFAKGQAVSGGAMLVGSISGGLIAQATNLGVPYIIRAVILAITLIVALTTMRDLGFTPKKNTGNIQQIKNLLRSSIDNGLKNRPVRWVMLAAPFTGGVGIFVFYAMQPYLLELYGDPSAYSIAGLAAAILAMAQIAGGLLVTRVLPFFKRRTNILIGCIVISTLAIAGLGLVHSFIAALALLVVWALMFAITMPVRQTYLNNLIDSKHRATVLSFDALMTSSGGIVTQPALGRAADVWSYGTSYMISAVVQLGALPFLFFARRENTDADIIEDASKEG